VYIDETERIVNLHIKDHQRDVRLKHVTQSALSQQYSNRTPNTWQNDYSCYYCLIFSKEIQRGSRNTKILE